MAHFSVSLIFWFCDLIFDVIKGNDGVIVEGESDPVYVRVDRLLSIKLENEGFKAAVRLLYGNRLPIIRRHIIPDRLLTKRCPKVHF